MFAESKRGTQHKLVDFDLNSHLIVCCVILCTVCESALLLYPLNDLHVISEYFG